MIIPDRVQLMSSRELQHEVVRLRNARNELNSQIVKLLTLVDAVEVTEWHGITCNDVAGKNWFTVRDELKK